MKNKIISFNSSEFKNLSKLFKADSQQDKLSIDNDKEVKLILKQAILGSENTYYIDSILRNDRIRVQQGCFSIIIDKKSKFIDYVILDILLQVFKVFLSKISDNSISKIIRKDIDKNGYNDKLINQIKKVHDEGDLLSDLKDVFITHIKTLRDSIKDSNYEYYVTAKIEISDKLIQDESENYANDFLKIKEELLINSFEMNKENIVTYTIPKENKAKLKNQLENIGITSTYVYPDIQGSIEYIKDQLN